MTTVTAHNAPKPVRCYQARSCEECGLLFQPTHSNQKMHRGCSKVRRCRLQGHSDAKRDARKHAERELRSGIAKPPIRDFAPDFLRALPEMKAELVRQTRAFTMPYILPSDPLEITSFRVATERRGTGNRGPLT